MPYKLRKAPKRELYWVVTTETGKKHSKEPIPLEKAKAQMRILSQALAGGALVLSEAVQKAIELLRQGMAEDMVRDLIVVYLDLDRDENEFDVMRQAKLEIANHPVRRDGGKRGGANMSEAIKKAIELLRRGLDEDVIRDSVVLYLMEGETVNQVIAIAKQYIESQGGSGGASCKAPYHDYTKGKASVFALTCIDPRYTFDVAYYLQNRKDLHQDYDLFTLAGASLGATKKEWTAAFMDNLALGLKLHGVKEVWCFDHLDCGMYKATFDLKTDTDPKIHKSCMDKLKAMIHKKHPQLKFREFLVDVKGHVKPMDEALKGGKKSCCGKGMTRPTLVEKDGVYSLEYKGRIIANSTNKAEMLADLNKISSALKKGAKFPHEKSDEGEYDFEAEVPKQSRVRRTNYKLDLLDKDDLSGKSKYSKVAVDVMKRGISKKDDAIFTWLKRQAIKGVNKEGVMGEMARLGVPESKQAELMKQVVDELVAEGFARHV